MIHEIEAFLENYLEGKSESMKKQARVALSHWEIFTRQKPTQVEQNDVDRFVYNYKRLLKPSSLSVYLFYIGKFLGSSTKKDIESYIMKIRNRLETEETTEPSPIDHHDILKMLTEVTDPQGSLLVRLLLFSDIPIGCLEELEVRHIYDARNYEIHCKGRRISGTFHSDTPEIISYIIEEKKLTRDNDRIVGITERHVQNLIPDYARKVGIAKKVTPKDIRKFGENPHLRKILIELYEDARKK